MNKMFYIQTYQKADLPSKEGYSRFLEGNYMGSAEFEFGSVGRAWSNLRCSPVRMFTHSVQSVGGKAALVTFYVVTTKQGFERFKANIDNHMDGKTLSQKSKERTGLWEKFNSERRYWDYPDAWLDVSPFVRNRNDDDAIFFTDDQILARRTYLYVMRGSSQIDVEDLRIGDMVLSPMSDDLVKVCGLNEDGTVSVKLKYGKAHKFHKQDIIPQSYLEVQQ